MNRKPHGKAQGRRLVRNQFPGAFRAVPLLLVLLAVSVPGRTQTFEDLVFTRDYTPGVLDPAGRYMGGTDTMFLLPHAGRLWAGISYWNDLPSGDPTPGPQILVKNAYDAGWRVDTSFGTEFVRVDAMASISFTTDVNGDRLDPPVTILLAALSDQRAPYEVTVWSRDDETGTWTRTVVTTDGVGKNTAYARVLFDHVDPETLPPRHYVFAGVATSALYRGAYDPAAPGRIVWYPEPELTGPARMMAAAHANDRLYLTVGSNDVPDDGQGGLFRRIDGPDPSWEFIWEWPANPGEQPGPNMRGLTAVPDPAGGGHEVLIGYIEPSRTIVRIDPLLDHAVTEELDLPAYFTAAWGGPATINYAAYNDMLQAAHPGGCETVNLIGIWGEHPDPIGTPARNNSWYIVRRVDGGYAHGQVIDPAIPVPSKRLRALRSLARSPFPEDGGRVFYAGGYDAGTPIPIWHETAWIYRGAIPADTTLPPPATGLRLVRAGSDLDFSWDAVTVDALGRRECMGTYAVWRAQRPDFSDALPLQETEDALTSMRVAGEGAEGLGVRFYPVRARDAAGNAGP
jgi:hypothetical protein